MYCINLHEHKVEIYSYNNQNFALKYQLNNLDKCYEIHRNSLNIYGIVCKNCKTFETDYNSNNSINHDNNDISISTPISMFCTEKAIKNINCGPYIVFKFFQLKNYLLIGNKNEIIEYMKHEYNILEKKINQINSSNEIKEKDIQKIENDLKNEKIKNERIQMQFNNINKEKNELNKNLEKEILVKNNLEEKLNIIKNDLIIEKDKNIKLNKQLVNISEETNSNVRRVLKEVNKEKKINKKLGSKISELKNEQEQQKMNNDQLNKCSKEKENKIIKLTNNNEHLGKNVEQLKKDIELKENQINEVNNSLFNSKSINQNITKNLEAEKEKNKILNNKLDNISSENNKNVQKVLEQIENEQKKYKNLELEISELKTKEKQNLEKNEELQNQLKNKEKELEEVKNKIPKNIGLQFESDCKIGEYDIILNITSFKDLVNGGWTVKYKDGLKENYTKKINENTIVVGVIGNGNKGKSFFLEKLSGYKIPQGFNVKTEGLSIRYGTKKDHIIAILDSAGQETPLLKMNNDSENNSNKKPIIDKVILKDANDKIKDEKKINDEKMIVNNIHKEKLNDDQVSENEEIEFEKYSRDKLITEYFIQRFIIWKSDILILVVGNITLSEQKLLSRVKTEISKLKSDKQIYVIHNLKDHTTDEQVNDYIENTLKKLYKIEINENIYQNIGENKEDNNKYFDKYFAEKGKKISHFIFVNQYSERADYYNTPTIKYIQKVLEINQERHPFPILEDCKEFIVKMSEEIMEENPKLENLIAQEDDKNDKIILKDFKEINLKKFVIDEMGYALNDMNNDPKYSYYINTEDKMFYVNIELPGGAKMTKNIEIGGGNYYFIYEGIKNGDEIIENDKKSETKKLLRIKNLRKNNKFRLIIQVPCSEMQILLENGKDLDEVGECTNDGKGVFTFKYKIVVLGNKKEKKKLKNLNL